MKIKSQCFSDKVFDKLITQIMSTNRNSADIMKQCENQNLICKEEDAIYK